MKRVPVVAITMGDPAGVGPEVCLKAAQHPRVRKSSRPLIVGDLGVLRAHARKMGIPGRLSSVTLEKMNKDFPGGSKTVPVLDMANVASRGRVFGKMSAALGKASADYIAAAARLALDGRADAMTTGPIHKGALYAGGHEFPGHTEMLAHICGKKRPVMMLIHGKTRIAHLSTHCSLRDAIRRVKRGRIVYVGRVFAEALASLLGRSPRIAVAGLNPHAGENGLFGKEEENEIVPAVADLRAEGFEAEGPEPPDTVFAKLKGGYYDGVVAMYHDQGHIAGKTVSFRFDSAGRCAVRGVNVTLGLPIIRTSVDHGTGFEIAGQGMADASSMVDAVLLAARMVRSREKAAPRKLARKK